MEEVVERVPKQQIKIKIKNKNSKIKPTANTSSLFYCMRIKIHEKSSVYAASIMNAKMQNACKRG